MAKLTRKQRQIVESALYHVRRAQTYIQQPSIAVCRTGRATTTLHYTRNGDEQDALYPVCKDIGSDLVGMADAERQLLALLVE